MPHTVYLTVATAVFDIILQTCLFFFQKVLMRIYLQTFYRDILSYDDVIMLGRRCHMSQRPLKGKENQLQLFL
jgi:hypothetical protein